MTREEFNDKWKNTSVFIWAKKDEFLHDYESVIEERMPKEEEKCKAIDAQQVAEVTKDCYPERFIAWKDELTSDGSIFHDTYGGYSFGEYDYTLNELFDYWTKNIKK